MVTISEKIYQELAQKLINELQHLHFYNGSIEIDYPELYTTFHCTLLIYRQSSSPFSPLKDILSVWWEMETATAYGLEYNDFSWGTFYQYLEAYF